MRPPSSRSATAKVAAAPDTRCRAAVSGGRAGPPPGPLLAPPRGEHGLGRAGVAGPGARGRTAQAVRAREKSALSRSSSRRRSTARRSVAPARSLSQVGRYRSPLDIHHRASETCRKAQLPRDRADRPRDRAALGRCEGVGRTVLSHVCDHRDPEAAPRERADLDDHTWRRPAPAVVLAEHLADSRCASDVDPPSVLQYRATHPTIRAVPLSTSTTQFERSRPASAHVVWCRCSRTASIEEHRLAGDVADLGSVLRDVIELVHIDALHPFAGHVDRHVGVRAAAQRDHPA